MDIMKKFGFGMVVVSVIAILLVTYDTLSGNFANREITRDMYMQLSNNVPYNSICRDDLRNYLDDGMVSNKEYFKIKDCVETERLRSAKRSLNG